MFDPDEWASAWNRSIEIVNGIPLNDPIRRQELFDRVVGPISLLMQLVNELRNVELLPADFFDRPRLAAVLSAVHQIKKEEHE
jgi:hypothetical protein